MPAQSPESTAARGRTAIFHEPDSASRNASTTSTAAGTPYPPLMPPHQPDQYTGKHQIDDGKPMYYWYLGQQILALDEE